MDLVLVLTTMPDDNRADELAQSLVDERLAACVNVHGPMISTFRWKGQVEHEAERQVVIKTTRARLPELGARLRALHPYEVPELVVLEGASHGAVIEKPDDVNFALTSFLERHLSAAKGPAGNGASARSGRRTPAARG